MTELIRLIKIIYEHMGVQKSRKSIRFTKFSNVKVKFAFLTNLIAKNTLQHVYDRHEFKKTKIFTLRNRKNDKNIFFGA
jgi:hypothetical protein